MKKILIVDNWTRDYTLNCLKDLIWSYKLWLFDIVSVDDFNGENANNSDLVILSWWSKYRARDKMFDRLKKRIIKTDKPIIGICLWCQILCTSKSNVLLKKMPLKIHGSYYPVIYQDLWEYDVYRVHRWKIIDNDNFRSSFSILWTSEIWVDVVKDKHKEHYWLSFHPELDLKKQDTYGSQIFKDIIDQIFN